jgi:hypothetical protein
LAAALALLLLAVLYSGQTVEAQRPSDVAVLAALANIQHMLVGQEGFFPAGSFVDTKTVDFEPHITILALGRPGTQVGVRITGFGTHRQVCARILDEIGRNLDAARQAPLAPGVLVLPAPAGMTGPAPLIILRPGSTVPPPPQPIPAK